MAKIILSAVIQDVRGKVGDKTFRHFKGRTVLQKAQERHQPWSGKQGRHRQTFGAATAFATSVGKDPALRKAYGATWRRKKKGLTFWQTAVRDFFHPPQIDRVVLDSLTPEAGGHLSIKASDDFEVVRVHVAIRDAAGAIHCFGNAEAKSGEWRYAFPAAAPDAPKLVGVVVSAFDRPGNVAIGSFPLS
jgi:hypothetical protein